MLVSRFYVDCMGDKILSDYMSKLVSLDPYMLQFAMSYIDYVRNNPQYLEETDIERYRSIVERLGLRK